MVATANSPAPTTPTIQGLEVGKASRKLGRLPNVCFLPVSVKSTNCVQRQQSLQFSGSRSVTKFHFAHCHARRFLGLPERHRKLTLASQPQPAKVSFLDW